MDGWIEWKGGECPIADDALVDIKFPDWDEILSTPAGDWNWGEDCYAIIAYRLAKEPAN